MSQLLILLELYTLVTFLKSYLQTVQSSSKGHLLKLVEEDMAELSKVATGFTKTVDGFLSKAELLEEVR